MSKLVSSIREAITLSGLRDGMSVSFHHHLRNGDFVLNMVLEQIAELGIKDINVNASSLFDAHAPILEHIENHGKKDQAEGGSGSSGGGVDDDDEMLIPAIDVVVEMGQASTSMLQRRLKLGYARAARIIDIMEERGIVGGYEGSKPRQVLITRDQWNEMKLRMKD